MFVPALQISPTEHVVAPNVRHLVFEILSSWYDRPFRVCDPTPSNAVS